MSIMAIGEAWGSNEEIEHKPFVGGAGYMLNTICRASGLPRESLYLTNVFNEHPPSNNLKHFTVKNKADGVPHLKPLPSGGYLAPKYLHHVERLWREVETVQPNLILALGNTPLWALVAGRHRITETRGTLSLSHIKTERSPEGVKVLPTYHPAAVMRDYSLLPVSVMDFRKAAREQHFPEIRRIRRAIHTEPSLEDIEQFFSTLADTPNAIGIDIETRDTYITEIGFAPTPHLAFVIPFVLNNGTPYWDTPHKEVCAWKLIKAFCEDPTKHFVGQNFLYDMKFLWMQYGIKCVVRDDTMLMHHAYQPELKKGLGFLASIYTDEVSWKTMRKMETRKQDD